MSYGGIDIVEIDKEHNFFYVHREDGDYWNRYYISEEIEFLGWIANHEEDIEVYDLEG